MRVIQHAASWDSGAPFSPQGSRIHPRIKTGADVDVVANAVLDAIELIQQVHGIGAQFPDVKVISKTDDKQESSAYRYRTYSQTGRLYDRKLMVVFSKDKFDVTRTIMAVLHEIGHYIDLSVQADELELFASETDLRWNAWRIAVMQSEHAKGLRTQGMRPPDRTDYPCLNESDGHYEAIAWRNRQLHELWARSYVQYIALKTGSAELMRLLQTYREPVFPEPRQWEPVDFEPVEQAMTALFQSLGWIA